MRSERRGGSASELMIVKKLQNTVHRNPLLACFYLLTMLFQICVRCFFPIFKLFWLFLLVDRVYFCG